MKKGPRQFAARALGFVLRDLVVDQLFGFSVIRMRFVV